MRRTEEGEMGGARGAKVWGFVGLAVALLTLNYAFGWSDMLFGTDGMATMRALLEENAPLAAAVYVAASIVACVALAMPGFVFALVAGTLFGPVWGTLLCWLAVTAGAVVAFLVGRFFLKDAVKPLLAKSPALNRLLFEGAAQSDVYLLAVTRLVPIFPYNLQNFAYGITDVSLGHYALYSAVFLLPGTAAYTVAAAGLVDEGQRAVCFAVAAVLLAATVAVGRALKGRVQAGEETGEETGESADAGSGARECSGDASEAGAKEAGTSAREHSREMSGACAREVNMGAQECLGDARCARTREGVARDGAAGEDAPRGDLSGGGRA